MSTGSVKAHISIDTTLQTERMILRYPNLSDAEMIFEPIQSSKFPEQLPLKEITTLSEVKTWIERLQENWSKSQVFSWIMELPKTKELIGQVTLARKDEDNVWALAFWINPEYWGEGYATEGAKRVLHFGFEVLDAKKIWAGAGVWNSGSRRVLEKIGMQHIGNNPSGYTSKGQPVETKEYEISRDLWLQQNQ